jgi:hypothetical protein
MNKKEGGESQLDVGGKMAIDFRQHTIRQLPRYKVFASSWRRPFSTPERKYQEKEIWISRRASAKSTARFAEEPFIA